MNKKEKNPHEPQFTSRLGHKKRLVNGNGRIIRRFIYK